MTRSGLRVGIVVPRSAPFRGGVETYVASAAAALAAESAEITVITQVPKGTALRRCEVVREGYTVERHDLPVADIFDIPSPAAVRAATEGGRFDVVWVHSYHTPLAWLVAERAPAPVVFTPHYHGVGHTPVRRLLHRAYQPAGRRLMTASRRIVVDTDAEADLVLRDFPGQVGREKVTVVPPVVTNPMQGRQPDPAEPNIVLTVARQEPYKRTDLLIRACAELRGRGIPVRLVVIGDGSARIACQELTRGLGADDVVTFTGAVDAATLGHWWASASLYATASQQEAYGIGVAESLLAGLPVVASDIPAHREVVHRAGPAAAAQLCDRDGSDAEATSRYADAIVALMPMADGRAERAATCTLPGPAEAVAQLLTTLCEVSGRARP